MNGFDWNAAINHPLTLIGAGMMAGSDPRGTGLGGIGQGILGAQAVMASQAAEAREQARLEEQQAMNRAAADLQMQKFQADIARQEREAAARQNLINQPGLTPIQRAAIGAGYGQIALAPEFRESAQPKTIEPLTDAGQITRDVRLGFLTPDQGQQMMDGVMAGGDAAERTKQEWAVYKDVQKQEAPYREVASRANQILAAINAPGGFSDTTLVSNIAKFLDPTSVVRPSETQALTEAGGLVASIQGMLTNAAGKGFITDTQRKEIRSMMGRLTDIYDKEYTARRQETGGFMERRGLSSDVMGKRVEFPNFQVQTPTSEPVSVQTRAGTVRVRPAIGGP